MFCCVICLRASIFVTLFTGSGVLVELSCSFSSAKAFASASLTGMTSENGAQQLYDAYSIVHFEQRGAARSPTTLTLSMLHARTRPLLACKNHPCSPNLGKCHTEGYRGSQSRTNAGSRSPLYCHSEWFSPNIMMPTIIWAYWL